ncbi:MULTISPECIES: maleylpyruvate isomerase family mycothiol-dependent enzyme [unclassified Actinoplanes]|uniref:maleylpyruvate isomerase family mycothiol-dependent enzyme n=1 Tax=unclassified Actinoplanes TaxID=2626549 RepID=UPI0005BE0C8D|nr:MULTISPECIES: maleylpyruvate isomerase family mycothiol-dependent enzyme [unclassified Actinoplanes]
MTTVTDVRAEIAAQRRELAALLAELTAEQWDRETLCDGWRVREVVAHVTQPFRASLPRFLVDFARAGGNFDRMADRVARRDAARLSSAALLAAVRDNVEHPWSPPGGGLVGALSHDVIHTLDIDPWREVPVARMTLVLGGMSPRSVGYFGADLDGVRLVATDRDWAHGAGEAVHGRAQDLLMVICGRRLPPGLLTGHPAARYTG